MNRGHKPLLRDGTQASYKSFYKFTLAYHEKTAYLIADQLGQGMAYSY